MRSGTSHKAQPFSEHVRELRLRLLYSIATLFLGSAVGYLMHQSLFRLIRRPLNEQLYYTTPAGGFNAIIKISIAFGVLVTIPVFIYQLGRFLRPAFRRHVRAAGIIFFSVILAAAGALFAYFVSLPAALHFLANIDDQNLQSLLTVSEYLNFVAAYLVGFALLFQIPLIILFINRIKPQRPAKLMHIQRYVILFSFVIAAILTPTPDPVNQIIMAMPIILLYQFSVVLIWFVNRRNRTIVAEPVPIVVAPTAGNVLTPDSQAATAVSAQNPQLITDVYWAPQNPST